jgi:hypothetical protein
MRKIALAIALMIAGCRNEAQPGPTAKQSDQLNEAESLLNEVDANDAQSNSVQ